MNFAATFQDQFSPLAPFALYLLIWVLVFIETGILIGFWLPGGSVLFSAGLVAATRNDMNIVILVTGVFFAAFVGDQIGYVLGRKYGRPYLQKKPSERRTKMIAQTEEFYLKNGWWAVVAARFFPWIRTFIPPVAGVGKMPYYKFLSANSTGALVWGVGITSAGYYSATIPLVKSSSYALAAFFIGGSIISVLWNRFRSN